MHKAEQIWYKMMENLEQVEFRQPEVFSPFCEVLDIDNNQQNQICVNYNGMYRYESILGPLFRNKEISREDKLWLNDVLLHFLFTMEFRSGISKKELHIRRKMQEILQEYYGSDEKKCYEELEVINKYQIAEGLLRQDRIGASVMLFAEMCTKVLGNCVLYKNAVEAKTIILNCSKRIKENLLYKDEIWLLKQLFLPIDYELRVYVDGTIGIIGEDSNMVPGKVVLF